jgi:hypothetical protein
MRILVQKKRLWSTVGVVVGVVVMAAYFVSICLTWMAHSPAIQAPVAAGAAPGRPSPGANESLDEWKKRTTESAAAMMDPNSQVLVIAYVQSNRVPQCSYLTNAELVWNGGRPDVDLIQYRRNRMRFASEQGKLKMTIELPPDDAYQFMNGSDTPRYPPNQILIAKAFEKGQFEKANVADYDIPDYDKQTFMFRFYSFNYDGHSIDDLVLPLVGFPEDKCDSLRKEKWRTAWEHFDYPNARVISKSPLSYKQTTHDSPETVIKYYNQFVPNVSCESFLKTEIVQRCDYNQIRFFIERDDNTGDTDISISGDITVALFHEQHDVGAIHY